MKIHKYICLKNMNMRKDKSKTAKKREESRRVK